MERSTPFINFPLEVQQSAEAAEEGNLLGNGFQQMPPMSSQSLLSFLPPLHDVDKGSIDLHGFTDSTSESIHEASLHPSFKMNDGCNLMLDPFSSDQQLGGEALSLRQNLLHRDSGIPTAVFSNQNANILHQDTDCLETSSKAHQSQEPEISLSSQTFNRNVESPEILPSNFDSAVPPSLSSYECEQCKKQFMQLIDLSEHLKSDHPSIGGGGTEENNPYFYQESEKKDFNSPNGGQCTGKTSEDADSSETIKCSVCHLKLSSQSDLIDHMNFEHDVNEEKRKEEYVHACALCPKAFKTLQNLEKHESRHPYKTSAIQCSKCGEILGNYILLQEHKQYEDYLSSCDICDQLFPNEECMMCHIRNAHNDFEDLSEEENSSKEEQGQPEENNQECHNHLPADMLTDAIPLSNTVGEELLCDDRTLEKSMSNSPLQESSIGPSSSPPQDKSALMNESSSTAHDEPIHNQSSQSEEAVETLSEPDVLVKTEPFCNESAVAEDVSHPEEAPESVEDQSPNDECGSVYGSSKPKKMKCQYCSKKCSTRTSLIRHERCHPYGTAAMKCNLCLEIVDNYKALKVHKKKLGAQVFCSTCNQICPNQLCLLCHVRNVHNNTVYKAKPVYSVSDDSNDVYNFGEEEASDNDEAHQYAVSRYAMSASSPPSRFTLKQEKEDDEYQPPSPTFSASTPPTPSTPSPQGPPTPSPPLFVYESEPSEAEDDNEYAPYVSDESVGAHSKRTTKRKSSLRSTRKSSTNSIQFLSSDESNHDESGDNYTPEESVSEEESDEDADWGQEENSVRNKKRARRQNPISDESDEDPDWRRVRSSAVAPKKKGRRKKGPLSDDSDNDVDWKVAKKPSFGTKKKARRKRGAFSDGDSDNDPDWKKSESVPGIIKKKETGPRRRGRPKKVQVAFFVPAIPVPKRPRARGLGGQKAQEAAAALAQAVEDMETTVPELKTVIRPVRRAVTKASLKRYTEVPDDEYDYLYVKPEPKDDQENSEQAQCSPQTVSEGGSHQGYINENSQLSPDTVDLDEQGEQIVIKAEPYDFQDDEQSTDLYFSRKFCETNTKPSKRSSFIKEDPDANVIKRERYGCKLCGRPMQYRSHLIRHLRKVHDGEGVEEVMRRMMQCRFCGKPYTNELSLINHEKLHDGTSKMKCNKCEERFDDKNALRRHQRKTHWEHEPVECEICKKQLSDNTCLKAHMKHMHGTEEKKVTIFTCETCGKQLHTKTAFQNHVASKCGTDLLFPCETCGKSFSFKGSLKAHQLLHSGVKSFLCKFCGKAFHQKGEMKRHERKHTGEKPFICEVCGRAFAYRESLLGHSAVHTGIKPFPCKACGMRFSCSGNLVKHRRSNNCKGFVEQEDIPVVDLGGENTPENANADLAIQSVPSNILPDGRVKPLHIGAVPNETTISSNQSNNIPNRNHSLSNEMNLANQIPIQKPEEINKQDPVQNMFSQISVQAHSNNQANIVSMAPTPESVSLGSPSMVGSATPICGPPMTDPASSVTRPQNSIPMSVSNPPMTVPANSSSSSPMSVPNMTSVIRSTPSIHVKSTAALQSVPKETKQSADEQVPQSYGAPSNVNNRLSSHVNSMYGNQESEMSAQSNYSSHNVASSYNENHFRQTNQVNVNDRRYMQFSMDGYSGRTDQYFDRQALMRHEMTRQAMERSVDRQASRYLDWTGGVQFSGVDSRSSIQSYASASMPHSPSYPNIHSSHLGNYAATHTASHTNPHTNMYGSNTMMPGGVNFSAFTTNNHIGMGYSANNSIAAHSVAHSSSYPASHMSQLEALFGHFSHPSGSSNNSFPRLSSQNVGSSSNSSLQSNHRV